MYFFLFKLKNSIYKEISSAEAFEYMSKYADTSAFKFDDDDIELLKGYILYMHAIECII